MNKLGPLIGAGEVEMAASRPRATVIRGSCDARRVSLVTLLLGVLVVFGVGSRARLRSGRSPSSPVV